MERRPAISLDDPGSGRKQQDEDSVLAYLRAHPDVLARHPDLYGALIPPRRHHGETMADHMEARVHQARTRAEAAERAQEAAAADRRAAEGFARRVQETVLALMRAADPAWLAVHELAGLLRVDAARLCSEKRERLGAASIPRGTIAATIGHRAALVRPAQPNALLHGEAVALAAQEALVRVPRVGGPDLLALACRDEAGLAGATTAALAFLGQAVGAALDRT